MRTQQTRPLSLQWFISVCVSASVYFVVCWYAFLRRRAIHVYHLLKIDPPHTLPRTFFLRLGCLTHETFG